MVLKNMDTRAETLPRGAPVASAGNVDSFGFDEPVREVAPAETKPVQTPACLVCNETRAVRYPDGYFNEVIICHVLEQMRQGASVHIRVVAR